METDRGRDHSPHHSPHHKPPQSRSSRVRAVRGIGVASTAYKPKRRRGNPKDPAKTVTKPSQTDAPSTDEAPRSRGRDVT